MSSWLGHAYPWIKSAHIVSVVAWMAGLFYLPRLFVYHAMVPPGSKRSEMLKVMERRLQKAIMTPAMLAAWGFGLLLAATPGVVDWYRGWFWAKLVLVAGLSVDHLLLGHWRQAFADDRNTFSHRFFRVANEAPTILLIAIVILVVVKPF